ncbi:MAG TPA: lysyl oxidase family protein, partial [Thermomicrobiales bacterium]|nr:lysyl oxidase family protein [Thermomicrobiales bacterium]
MVGIWLKGTGVLGNRRRWRATRFVLTIVIAIMASGQTLLGSSWAAGPVYPDLVPLRTSNMSVEKASNGHYLLRFDSITANFGGPLEIVVPSLTNRQIFQNIYNATKGGDIVVHTRIGADILFHPTHNHFHFQDFNDFSLVKRDSKGIYRETSRRGDKSSSCILDLMRVKSTGYSYRTYGACGATMQGLSAGWADIYDASLPGQYIDLGTSMPADGMYGIRTTADPLNKLFESNDQNNTLVSYFSIAKGRLVPNGSLPPTCSANGGAGSVAAKVTTVGATVAVTCTGLKPYESVQLFWGSTNTAPRGTATVASTGMLSTTFAIPITDQGVHYILIRGNATAYQSAAIVNIVPSLTLSPSTIRPERMTAVSLWGFSPGEIIDIGYWKSATQRVL